MAVVELIKEGQRKGIWEYKTDPVVVPIAPVVEKKPLVISSEIKKEEPKLLEPKKEEVNVEEKKDVVVQPQTQSETKTETLPPAPTAEVKKEVAPLDELPAEMILSVDSFIYKEANDKSQKTWQFKKGTTVSIVGQEGDWILVRDAEKRRGFVKKDVLVNKQQ
jgi:hypothetical protein